jgi:hypothetical protein
VVHQQSDPLEPHQELRDPLLQRKVQLEQELVRVQLQQQLDLRHQQKAALQVGHGESKT